jgi:ABC-type multidrug transport system fused ATPase/permease subunit
MYLGPSVFWGIGVLLSVVPINSITLRILDRLARAENESKDARTKRTTESITNMKLLKVQAWERRFAEDISGHRNDELSRHKTRGLIRALNSAISNAVPALVLVVTLKAYAKTGRPIVASTIFTAISLFNQLRFPLFFYPMLIDSLANGKNSLRRISSYLSSEEITPYVQKLPPNNGGSIEIRNGNFLWSTSEAPKDGEVAPPAAPALCGVNLKIKPGEVVAIVGPVGSGKSALIKGLLGELTPVPRIVVAGSSEEVGSEGLIDKPSVVMEGNAAYCSQEAWLPKGTIRDAIVFGREYDEARYMAAIRDAVLDKDMDDNVTGKGLKAAASSGVLSHDTDVGEGGSSLSGGQRARVALARALYCGDDTRVFLLDDCLAALDASVGSLVFERVTNRLKASNAATMIVTNDPSLPRRCDRVVLMGPMENKFSSSSCATVVDVGTYDELIARGHNLKTFSSEEADETSETNNHDDGDSTNSGRFFQDEKVLPQPSPTVRVIGGYKVSVNSTDGSCHADPDCTEVDMQNCLDFVADQVVPRSPDGEISDDENPKSGILHHSENPNSERDNSFAQEEKTVGKPEKNAQELGTRPTKLISADDKMSVEAVPFSTYVSYFKAVRSPKLIIATIAAFITANAAQFFQQYTVAKWTELSRGGAMATALGGHYMNQLVYSAGVVSVFLWIRSYFNMLVGVRASEFYHSKMISSVFKAPMSFFDATPSGQILSRFGKELETIDRALPESLASVLFCGLQITSSALALAGAITPGMMIPLIFVGSLYGKTIKKFRPAARDMKRTESKTRSPIFTHFGEALRGTEVIRSIPGAAQTWSTNHRSLTDTNLSVFSTVKALDRWLSCILEALGNFLVFMAAFASVVLSRAGRLNPGSAGWGLTQSLAITGLMAWAVRNLTYLESHMMSVMRVSELTDLDSEEAVVPSGASPAVSGKQKSRMPKELAAAGEALQSEFSDDACLNVTVVPLNETALVADGWPWTGDVEFEKVSMRYNPSSPLVLRDVTLSVPPGTTLGVVGRTGSGKSSLLLLLFRIVEIEIGGSIKIDGVDIRSISIQTLRENLAIIPQDPTLFAGTIAYNLDATGRTSAEEMWAALEAATPELAAQFRGSGGLETTVSEGGNSLSLGQRQLICLARALLRKSKILVLDEATSSVDSGTDQQVQDTIRKQFVDKGVTVITVAHRLDTVLGYDKIAVLGDGKIVEYGAPSELLKMRRGELRRLVDADRLNKRKGGKQATNLVTA